MNQILRSRVAVVGLFLVSGIAFTVYQRWPSGTPVAALRDAGLFSEREDRWVMACPEKITRATRNYLKNNGYGSFGVGSIHRIARVVIQHGLPDGGKELVSTSLDLLNADAGEIDGGDEDDETDDALQFRTDDCFRLECDDETDSGIRELRLLPDGGFRHSRADGGEVPWCNASARRGRLTPPCVVPNCWTLPDGGWDDNAVADCLVPGRFGGPVWAGCNVVPAAGATGLACVPVECGVVAGDDPIQVLR